jgi:hypothetical protein
MPKTCGRVISCRSQTCTGYLAHPFKKRRTWPPCLSFYEDFPRTDVPSSQYRGAVSCRWEIGEGTRRRVRGEPHSRKEKACLDCPLTKIPAQRGCTEVTRIIHHLQWQHPKLNKNVRFRAASVPQPVLAIQPLRPARPVTLGRRQQRHVVSFRVIPLSFLGRAVFPVGTCWCAYGQPWPTW